MNFKIITENRGQAPLCSPSMGELHVSNWLLPLYSDFCLKPPKLLLKNKGEELTILTGEPIKKGQVVTEYLGEYSSQPSPYRFGPLDGLHYRSLAAMVDDGFPNLGAFYLYHNGLKILFVSIEDIKEGETLLISYGLNHSVKMLENREEFRLQEMFAYFKEHSLSSLVSYLKPLSQTAVQLMEEHTYFEFEAHLNRLQYPFHTPKALSLLLEEGIFDKHEVKTFFNKLDHKLYLLGFPILMNSKQQLVHDQVSSLLQ